jgi:cellulose 1,4-beta-cellobiosidase
LFALVIVSIAIGVGDLKKTQGQTSSCNSSYKENTAWNVGFQGEITVTNNGPAINGWTVTFTFPVAGETIYELWNGVFTQTGQNVTVTNASYNPNIPAGGSVTFGFNANWTGSHPAPIGITLNGQSCGGGGGGPVIQTSVTTLSVNEGGSAQFGVRLSSAPASNVTVNVARLSGDTDLSVTGGATLTFTPANFGTFQNVTISAAEDADATNGTAVIRASGTGLASADVNVSEVDNDPPPPIAIQTSVTTLSVNEGASAQFGVRLASAPAANVTVNVARVSGDTDLTVSGGATLTFTPANFGTFQNVTIRAAEDADITNGTAMFQMSGTGLTNAAADVSEFDNDGLPIAQRTYVATLNGASEVPPEITAATGTATVILSPDETAALISLSFANLSSPQTSAHIHGPADPVITPPEY